MLKLRLSMTVVSIVFLLSILAVGQSTAEKYKLGLNAQAENDHKKAVKIFQESLETEGETPECLANLGLSLKHISANYLNEAHKNFLKALQIDPKHEETLSYMGELYLLQGNLVKANSILQQLQKLESDEAEGLKEKLDQVKAQIKLLK